jgi:DNA-binding CsgD family transcriptional regulator
MSATAVQVASPRRLRGRVEEWKSVLGLLEATAAGRGGLLLVDGAAGTGKTRLLTAAEDRAASQGFSLARARTDELPRPAETQYGSRAARQPLLVTVDDLRGTDEVTTDELRALPTRLDDQPVGWVVVRRTTAEAPEADWPFDWHRPTAARVELGPLSPEATAAIGADVLRARPDPELLSMAEGAAGNPMLLVALFEGLRDEGLVVAAGGRVRLLGEQLPRRVEDVIDGWVRWLSPAARNILEVAACLDQPFTMDDLAWMLGWPLGKLLAPLHELVIGGLLTIGHQGVLAFQHDLVRVSMLRRVPVAVRGVLTDSQRAAGSQPGAAQTGDGDADATPGTDWDRLSESERTVADLVVQGMTNREAAARLFLSPHTVSFHLRKVYRKLGVGSRVELTRLYLERERAGLGLKQGCPEIQGGPERIQGGPEPDGAGAVSAPTGPGPGR